MLLTPFYAAMLTPPCRRQREGIAAAYIRPYYAAADTLRAAAVARADVSSLLSLFADHAMLLPIYAVAAAMLPCFDADFHALPPP